MSDNLLEKYAWEVVEINIASCKVDWQCSQLACGHLNDPSATQCVLTGCQTPRPANWQACGESFPLKADNVVVTIGNGSLEEVMLKPCGQENGAWIPVDEKNKLTVIKIENVEPIFGVRVMVVDGADHSAGNFVCFHSQMFNHKSLATALNNKEPKVGCPVEITYNAEVMSTVPGNIQMKITLEPVKQIKTVVNAEISKTLGRQFSRSAKELSVDEINDVVEHANGALLNLHKVAIQLDTSEMAIPRTPDQNINNINKIAPAHKRRHPTLNEALTDVRARQEVEEYIQLQDELMPSGYALAKMSIDMLQEKSIELFVAGLENSAQHCVAALQEDFAEDGSNGTELLENNMRHLTQDKAKYSKYAFDESVYTKLSICPWTGNQILTLETSNNGENQRDGCTPNALRKIQELREKKILSILNAAKNADEADLDQLLRDYNEALQDIWNETIDCEDGAQSVAKHALGSLHVLGKIQQAKSMREKTRIYQRCVGQTLDMITSHSAYTPDERKNLRTGMRKLWLHMSNAIGDIDKVGIPMTGLWFAGGASQSLQTQQQSDQDTEKDVISIENEAVKMQTEFVGKAGHAAARKATTGMPVKTINVPGVGTLNTYIQEEPEPFETTASYFEQNPKDIIKATDEVEKNVYCENAEDALQVQQMQKVEQMLGQSNANNSEALNHKCAECWDEIFKKNVAKNALGCQIEYKPCVTKPQARAFYVGDLAGSLWNEKTDESAPCVTVDTAKKLASTSAAGNHDNDHMHVTISNLTIENDTLEAFAALQRRYSDANGPGNAEAKLRSKFLRNGVPLFGRIESYGNPSGIDPRSLFCVYISVLGALEKQQLSRNTSKTVSLNMEFIGKLTVEDHAANLSACSKEKWGALVVAKTTLNHAIIMNVAAYPQPLHDGLMH